MVFDYELLDENENDENSKVMNFNSIDMKKSVVCVISGLKFNWLLEGGYKSQGDIYAGGIP